MRSIVASLCCAVICLSCTRQDARLASLDLEAKAAQVLLIGVEGKGRPSSDSLVLLEKLSVGGVLLFGQNLPEEPIDTGDLTAALQDAAARGWRSRGEARGEKRGLSPIPLIVAIDHEGGLVFRFKGEGITRLPSPAQVGPKGPAYASLLGRIAGAELRALGITMNLAPVVELLSDGNEAFLGTRAYGREASVVDAASGAFIEGMQAEGVAAVAKHFPGNAAEDPHKVLPRLELSKAEYEREYLPRFASAARRHVAAVMLSHVVLPSIDPDRPSSLSPLLVRGELRRRLGFSGLAITDDLCMRALSAGRSPEKSAVEALAAGADLLMLVDMREALRVRDAIVSAVKDGRLPAARLDEAAGRVLAIKSRFRMEDAADPVKRTKALAAFPVLVREDAARLRKYGR
jgi:beta-N-acetylhexosaminidase